MVQDAKRFLAYICPHCRQSVIVERDLFSLAAAPARIKCPCGKSELRVEFLPNRVELTVDQQALYDLILDVFYEEIPAPTDTAGE